MLKPKVLAAVLMFAILLPAPLFAGVSSDINRFTYGLQRAIAAPFQIPIQALRGTATGPPLVGTVGGVLRGTVGTVGGLVGGSFHMAVAAAPYAKYAALAL
jgi:hypothetical protein